MVKTTSQTLLSFWDQYAHLYDDCFSAFREWFIIDCPEEYRESVFSRFEMFFARSPVLSEYLWRAVEYATDSIVDRYDPSEARFILSYFRGDSYPSDWKQMDLILQAINFTMLYPFEARIISSKGKVDVVQICIGMEIMVFLMEDYLNIRKT